MALAELRFKAGLLWQLALSPHAASMRMASSFAESGSLVQKSVVAIRQASLLFFFAFVLASVRVCSPTAAVFPEPPCGDEGGVSFLGKNRFRRLGICLSAAEIALFLKEKLLLAFN